MIARRFAFLDFEEPETVLTTLSLTLSGVRRGPLLNAYMCLKGNETSAFFGLNPPDIRNYFNNDPLTAQ